MKRRSSKTTYALRDLDAASKHGTPGSETMFRDSASKGIHPGNEKKNHSSQTAEFTCPNCGKVFQKSQGLALHKTRWCTNSRSTPPRDSASDHKAVDSRRDASVKNHWTPEFKSYFSHSTNPSQINLDGFVVKPPLKLPYQNNTERWKDIDDQVSKQLSYLWPKISSSDISKAMKLFEDCVYSTLEEFCKTTEASSHPKSKPYKQNNARRLRKIRALLKKSRKTFRTLNKLPKKDRGKQRKLYWQTVRAYSDLKKCLDKESKHVQKQKQIISFSENPDAFAQNLFSPPNNGEPGFDKKVADDFFKKTYEDSERNYSYGPPPGLPRPAKPCIPFNLEKPSEDEISKIIWKKKNNSSPGFNGIGYLVYKRCPRVKQRLISLLQRIWDKKKIPTSWCVARIKLLAKSDDTSEPSLMRPITVLNVEGRIFFSVFQSRLSSFMLKNKYLVLRVQKAFLAGVSGCIEHATTLSAILDDAKDRLKSICISWLDLANAYGSVRHNMIQFALKWYHVPKSMCELIYNYYDKIFAQVHTKDWISCWFALATGAPQGCTASTIVFDVAFQLVLDILEFLTPTVEPFTIRNTSVHVKDPTYADDIALVTKTPDDNQLCIDAFSKATDWTVTMKAKPKKCFSLAFRLFKKGEKSRYKKVLLTRYSSFDPLLSIKGHQLQFIGSLPKGPPMFKYLGCFIQYDLGTNYIVEQLESKFGSWLQLVDDTLLSGPQKAWIANRYVCMKVAWILMVHTLPLGTINKLHRLLHAHYRKWIGLARCMDPSVLYRSRENFGLNFTDLRRLHKNLQVSKYHILKYSKDEQIKNLYTHLLQREQKRKNTIPSLKRPPRKKPYKGFSGPLELERLEGIVACDNLTRKAQSDRKGLGYNSNSKDKLSDRERLIAVRKEEAEHKWKVLSLTYVMQGEWLQYTDCMMADDLSWGKFSGATLIAYSSSR